MILADFEQKTVDSSRALLPTSNTYYKILDIHPGNIGVKLLSLEDGSRRTTSMDKIKKIELKDLLGISFRAADLFKELRTARTNTAFKKMTKQLLLNKDEIQKAELEVSNINISNISSKTILKSKCQSQYPFDIYNFKNCQIAAIKRAIQIDQELGLSLTKDQEKFLKCAGKKEESLKNFQIIYPADTSDSIMRRKNHPKKVSFHTNTKDIFSKNETNILYQYTMQADYICLKCCTSRQELKAIR